MASTCRAGGVEIPAFVFGDFRAVVLGEEFEPLVRSVLELAVARVDDGHGQCEEEPLRARHRDGQIARFLRGGGRDAGGVGEPDFSLRLRLPSGITSATRLAPNWRATTLW